MSEEEQRYLGEYLKRKGNSVSWRRISRQDTDIVLLRSASFGLGLNVARTLGTVRHRLTRSKHVSPVLMLVAYPPAVRRRYWWNKFPGRLERDCRLHLSPLAPNWRDLAWDYHHHWLLHREWSNMIPRYRARESRLIFLLLDRTHLLCDGLEDTFDCFCMKHGHTDAHSRRGIDTDNDLKQSNKHPEREREREREKQKPTYKSQANKLMPSSMYGRCQIVGDNIASFL